MPRWRTIAWVLCAAGNLSLATTASAEPETQSSASIWGSLTDDFEYAVDNFQLDVRDIATSPLQIASENSAFRSPRFYLGLLGAGALWGGSFALDQTLRSHLRRMSPSDADLLQDISYGSIGFTSAVLYGYGLFTDDARMRQSMLTAGEGAGLATVFDAAAIKPLFGRPRPKDNPHHSEFFRGGQSFVSGDVTPMFGLAAGISEIFDNRWYVAAPAYSLALLDGFGRVGHDAHWFSDVVGAGMLGWASTELFLALHAQHAKQPERWRIFPFTAPAMPVSGARRAAPTGLALQYRW